LSAYFTSLLVPASVPQTSLDWEQLVRILPTLSDAQLGEYKLAGGLQELLAAQASPAPSDEQDSSKDEDVEGMETDDLLSMLQSRYGKDSEES